MKISASNEICVEVPKFRIRIKRTVVNGTAIRARDFATIMKNDKDSINPWKF